MTNISYLAEPTLKIDGKEAPAELMQDIQEIVVEESLSLPAMFMLVINNDYFPGRRADTPWQHEALFEVGTAVEIGFISSTTQDPSFSEAQEKAVIKGEVTSIEAHFNARTQAPIIIRGYDVSQRLHRGRYNRSFQNMSDSDIVKKIAAEVGISLETIDNSGGPYGYGDIGNQNGYVFQENKTNMEFLRDLAARNGFELFVQAGKLNFRKPQADDTIEIRWLKELLDFQVRVTSSEQVGTVEVRGWDYKQKKALVAKKNNSSAQVMTETEYGSGKKTSSTFQGQPKAPTMLVVNQSIFSQDQGEKIAQAVFDEIARDFVQAEATTAGNPQICPGKLIKIADMGKYSGQYYVTETRHRFSAGDYTTEFTVHGIRGEENLSLLASSSSPPSGQTVLVGIVSNNKDPLGWGRVRVKFPTLTEEHESYWARVVGIGAGKDRGFYCLPEVDDEVLVVFEHGDIHRPYIIGGVWNGQDAPPTKVDDTVVDGKIGLRTLKTRTGHTLQFVEEDKGSDKKGVYLDTVYEHKVHLNDSEKKIEIQTQNGHVVKLDDQNKQIEIQTNGGHLINLNDQGEKIEIKTKGGKGSITMNSTTGNVEVTANGSIEISGKGSVKISGNGTVKIEGAMIEISSKANVKVEGAIIDISSKGILNIKGTMTKIN